MEKDLKILLIAFFILLFSMVSFNLFDDVTGKAIVSRSVKMSTGVYASAVSNPSGNAPQFSSFQELTQVLGISDSQLKYNSCTFSSTRTSGKCNLNLEIKTGKTGNTFQTGRDFTVGGAIINQQSGWITEKITFKGPTNGPRDFRNSINLEQVCTEARGCQLNTGIINKAGKYKVEMEISESVSNLDGSYIEGIQIEKSLSKTTVIADDTITVTLKVINNNNKEMSFTLIDNIPDFIEIVRNNNELQDVTFNNFKEFEIIVPANNFVEKTYQLRFSGIPAQLWNKELSTGIAEIIDKEGNKIQSNDPKVLFSKIISSFVAAQCDYDYVCDSGENYNTCFQDCTSGSSDGYCDGLQDRRCDADCNANTDADCRTAQPGGFVSLTGHTVALPPAQGKRVPGTSEVPFGSSSSSGGLSATGGSKPAGTPPVGTPIPVLNAPAPSDPTGTLCGNGACGSYETCANCPIDCGECSYYGTSLGNRHVPCGSYFIWDNKKSVWAPFLKVKFNNLNVGNPTIKLKIREWIFSNNNLYDQIKNEIYDSSVREISRRIYNKYYSGENWATRYKMTSCGNMQDPTPDWALLNGYGNCVDWSNLVVSLLRTMGVPQERIFMVCFKTKGAGWYPGHCTAAYKSDSNDWWIIDYGMIFKDTSLGGSEWGCAASDEWAHWGNDWGYGYGMRGVSCY